MVFGGRTAVSADPTGWWAAAPPLGVLEYLDLDDDRPVRLKRRAAFASTLLAEDLGYRRLWIPEHHGTGVPSTNPALLAAVLASHTTRIRVGTAVNLARVRDPHLVAEDLVTAGSFAGDRLDVGFGRGDVSGPAATALAGLRKDDVATEAAIGTAVAALRGGCDWIDPLEVPCQMWMHGAGTRSAELAARWEFHYCHAMFFNPDLDACASTLARYRAGFPGGRTAVAVAVVANDDARTARTDGLRAGISVGCAGTARQCAATIEALLDGSGADEVVLTELSRDAGDHHRALRDIHAHVAGARRSACGGGPR
ncbi:hypothetical protein GCM10023222_42050 [Saccharopolyspora cebuensis]